MFPRGVELRKREELKTVRNLAGDMDLHKQTNLFCKTMLRMH